MAVDFTEIGGTKLLERLRQQQNQETFQQSPHETGLQFGLRSAGTVIGQQIRRGTNAIGLSQDKQQKQAEAFDRASERANSAATDIEDPFERDIAIRDNMAKELRAIGEHERATQIEGQSLAARMQLSELRLLQGKQALAEEGLALDRDKLKQAGRDQKAIELQDEITNLRGLRDKTTQPGSPGYMTFTHQIDQLNAIIDKEGLPIGRTEHDVGLNKKTSNTVEDQLLFARSMKDSLDGALRSFNPDDLTFLAQMDTNILKARDFFLGSDTLSPTEKATLTRRTDTIMNGISIVNTNIRELTGATVGTTGKGFIRDESEEGRLRAQVPDVNKDSGTVFTAKANRLGILLDAVMARGQAALAAPEADQLSIMLSPLDNWFTQNTPAETENPLQQRLNDLKNRAAQRAQQVQQ
jgi:hypothetical protein